MSKLVVVTGPGPGAPGNPDPGGGREDLLVIGADGHVWHTFSETGHPGLWGSTWEDLGGHPAGAWKSVSASWTASANEFIVTAHGPDDLPWFKIWTVFAGVGWAPINDPSAPFGWWTNVHATLAP